MVARLKLAGFIDSTPDRRLAPTKRFFARPLRRVAGAARACPTRSTTPTADALTIDDYLIERPSQTVLVRVKGDSMMDAGILEGDLVVVEKTRRGQARRHRRRDRRQPVHAEAARPRPRPASCCKPENKAYPVIRPEGTLEIFGVMVGLVRKL